MKVFSRAGFINSGCKFFGVVHLFTESVSDSVVEMEVGFVKLFSKKGEYDSTTVYNVRHRETLKTQNNIKRRVKVIKSRLTGSKVEPVILNNQTIIRS